MVEAEIEETYANTQILEKIDKHEARETTEESIWVGVKEAEEKEKLDNVHEEFTSGPRVGRILEGAKVKETKEQWVDLINEKIQERENKE